MNDASLSARALAAFDAALDQPEEDRTRWLEAFCAGDDALEGEALLLLNASRSAQGILEQSPHAATPPDVERAMAAALESRYEVLREIGRGGMATVFLARERKHDREVVLKVLNPLIAQLCGKERFQREVHIAATLAHPNIVPLIDSGDAAGFLYYVMPWMEGRSLRDELQVERPSLASAPRILRDIALALDCAHRSGVIHRDLKPENVLLASGHAYLLDFGIAKLGSDSFESTGITAPGFALGTRRYMAPEQTYSAAAVDARADIFAWGVLGAELLTGAPLPAGEPQAVARRELARRAGLPAHMVALLLDCLAMDPASRPVDMHSVLERMDAKRAAPRPRAAPWQTGTHRFLTGATVSAALLAGVFAVRAARQVPPVALAEPVAVSVLRNETGDTSLTVLGRFAGDWVTDGLQRLGVAKVVPWSGALLASEHAAATDASIVTTLKDETLAGTVVTGSYYRVRDSLHLQAQLVDTRSGELVSALAPIVVPISRPEDAVSQLRDRVMGAVASARDETMASIPGQTRNPPSYPAYEAFNAGLDAFFAQKYTAALAQFREAFDRDSTFGAAALWGARAALNTDSLPQAGALARRARAASGTVTPGAFQDASLRYIEARLLGDGTAARTAIARAAALAPNSRAGFEHAVALLSAGYVSAARDQLLRMDPNRGELRGWSPYWTQRAHVDYLIGDHLAELADARELQRRFPDRRVATVLQARALASLGELRALDSSLVAWQSLPPDVYWSQGAALVVASEELMRRGNEAAGRRYAARAITWLRERLIAAPNDRSHRYWLGSVYYDLGRYDAARPYFESLARDYPDRIEYRGLAAIVAARRKDQAAAERWLGPAGPTEIGEHLAFCARIAAINGKTESALTFLASAVDHGIEHYPWLAESAFRDFAVLEREPRGRALLHGR